MGGGIRGRLGAQLKPVVWPEALAGSTRLKSGTAQKLVLNMISTGASRDEAEAVH